MAIATAPIRGWLPDEPIPPLENGDHLTRDEFERRYAAMPKGVKAELIGGVVYLMASPSRLRKHGLPLSLLTWWLVQYRVGTPGVIPGDDATIRLEGDSEPQPDALLMIEPEQGGQALIDEDDYVAGAPELVAEVAASSASYDLHEKLRAYCRSGIREYVVWRVLDRAID